MGRFCRICGRTRPNENFSGKGHRRCICKKCQKRPKEEIALIEAKDELLNYWEQSNISALNIARLKKLAQFPSEDIQKLAHLTLAVAAVKPHKRRRMKWLRLNHRDLYLRVRDYFGGEYFAEYGPKDIEVDEFEHTDDDYMEFFQESATDGKEQPWSDDGDDEPLPF
jgi:hypothetical protein